MVSNKKYHRALEEICRLRDENEKLKKKLRSEKRTNYARRAAYMNDFSKHIKFNTEALRMLEQ